MQARVRQMVCVAAVAAGLVGVLGASLEAADPLTGTWKLNLAKSTYDPGPPPLSDTIVYQPWETDGLTSTETEVEADGTRVTSACSFHYDGKDYKFTFTAGTPDVDTSAIRRVDSNTVAYTNKEGGKVVQTGTIVVSGNGKVLTITWTGIDAQGQREKGVEVYDKQ
jgi:hypothetical protein